MKIVNGISTVAHASTYTKCALRLWMGFLFQRRKKNPRVTEWFGWNISNKNMVGLEQNELGQCIIFTFSMCIMNPSHTFIVHIELHKRGIWFAIQCEGCFFPWDLRTSTIYYTLLHIWMWVHVIATIHSNICRCFFPFT